MLCRVTARKTGPTQYHPSASAGRAQCSPVGDDSVAVLPVRMVEVALHAHPRDGVVHAMAPAARQRLQAVGAVGVPAARLALLVARARHHPAQLVLRLLALVHPLAAQPELVLGRVHREREALLHGVAPGGWHGRHAFVRLRLTSARNSPWSCYEVAIICVEDSDLVD
jgi:hypothetical protein